MKPLKTLPLYTASAADGARLFARQRRELQSRADFVRAYLARDRCDGNGDPLDPVLASHLGLTVPAPKTDNTE